MTKTNAVTSGIDLSNLTALQLTALAGEANVQLNKVTKAQNEVTKKNLKDSGELKKLKSEWLALSKEGDKLARNISFDVILPVRFTISTDGPHVDCAFDYSSPSVSDLFDQEITAKLQKSDQLNKKQYKILSSTVEECVIDACEEIWELAPPEIEATFNAFTNKVKEFVKVAREHGLTIEDLE